MKRLRGEEGTVLLLVLVVVALLATLLTEFAFSTLVELRLAETFRDSTRAWYLARGGVTVGRRLLQEDRNSYDALGGPEELWSQGVSSYPVGDGTVSILIEDLGGRLDINTLVDATGFNVNVEVRRRFYRLFALLGLEAPQQLTAALIDWIDRDAAPYVDPQSGGRIGAEDEYYRQLERPYPCKNAPLDTLEELAMVRGFTPEVIGLVAPHVSIRGDVKVNVNTAGAEVLMSLSEDPVIDRAAAERIIALRREEPFRSAAELQRLNRLPGLENLLHAPFGVSSPAYLIHSRATVNDGARSAEALVEKAGDRLLYLKVN
jgi:general secretion pathway protein K